MDDFIPKPFDRPRLVEVLRRCDRTATAPQARLKILVAEDHPVNQRFAALVLASLGHDHDLVDNGLDAVRAALSGQYDLVLMDCQMPGMDGYAATAAIRAEAAGRRLPILAVTAQSLPGDRERCIDAGMDGYVSKPYTQEALGAAIAQVVAARASVLPGA